MIEIKGLQEAIKDMARELEDYPDLTLTHSSYYRITRDGDTYSISAHAADRIVYPDEDDLVTADSLIIFPHLCDRGGDAEELTTYVTDYFSSIDIALANAKGSGIDPVMPLMMMSDERSTYTARRLIDGRLITIVNVKINQQVPGMVLLSPVLLHVMGSNDPEYFALNYRLPAEPWTELPKLPDKLRDAGLPPDTRDAYVRALETLNEHRKQDCGDDRETVTGLCRLAKHCMTLELIYYVCGGDVPAIIYEEQQNLLRKDLRNIR